MNTGREQNSDNQQGQSASQEKEHLNPFKEANSSEETNTANVEEEAQLEQERKEAMSERD